MGPIKHTKLEVVSDDKGLCFVALCPLLEEKGSQFQNVCEGEKDSKVWLWVRSF